MFEGPVCHGAAEIAGVERRSRGRSKEMIKLERGKGNNEPAEFSKMGPPQRPD